jgi:hypothetical protein
VNWGMRKNWRGSDYREIVVSWPGPSSSVDYPDGRVAFVCTIQAEAFSNSSLTSIIISQTVEIIGFSWFDDYKSLWSILIESDSWLRRIESEAFSLTSLRSVCLPESF